MDTLLQDLRYAARTLLRSPAFAAVAVVTMALGIGIDTTIFSVVNTILIRPFPQLHTDGLVVLRGTRNGSDDGANALSPADVFDWRAQSTSFQGIAAYGDRNVVLTGAGGEPEQVEAEQVTPDLFTLLGARPLLGRVFVPEDGTPGRGDVVLLTHMIWERRFASDPSIVGRTITVNGAPHTVVGVMPDHFGFPDNQQLWIPMSLRSGEGRGDRYLRAVARLRPGVGIARAQAEMDAVARRLAAQYPDTNTGWSARVVDFGEAWAGPVRAVLLVMLGAVGFVLLIACANVANLFLARAAGRQKEMAVRTALGAGRGRVVRQLLTESSLVALMGGALGILVAYWVLDLILASFPFQPPLWMTFGIDRNVLLFTLVVSLGTGILFGLAPALRATRADVQGTLKDGGRGSTSGVRQGRLRGSLVVGELALAMVLLVGATLMIRSFLRLQGADPGFDTSSVLTLRVIASGDRYRQDAPRDALFRQTVERVAALPRVRGAATVSYLPLSGISATSGFEVEGSPAAPGERPDAEYRGISPDYFRVMGIRMLRGRSLTADEVEHAAPVVVVNRTMAERFWPGRDPLGRRIRIGDPWLTVVGVAEDVRMSRLNEKPSSQVYAPYTERSPASMTLLVRTGGDPAAATAEVRRAIRAVDPTVVADEVVAMDEVLHRSLWQQRLFGGLFTSFAAIALLLAVTGVYGVIAYSVSQRTHEIGVRMALGARPERILRMVVGQAARLAGVGVGIGLLGALAVTRLLASALYGVSPTDPVAFGVTTLLLAGAALAASWIPARRAVRVDPMVALRQD
ncbi:MAG: ABC transporter permease [Gemmatimonadetes bacterium]|nr:ABC transporter permease [Gemmatimonadota bacterium]